MHENNKHIIKMDLGRAHSFMDDPEDFNLLDDTFFVDEDGADLGNVFDGDDELLHDMSSPTLDDVNETGKDNENSTAGRNNASDKDSNEKGKGGAHKKKRRRSGLSVGGDSARPAPTWHNQVADKPHREKMLKEIAQLLKARKKTTPTKEWMKQLPHKARVLEDRLYKGAPSLESYLDRSTLKNRLKKLAVTITAHYQKTCKGRKHCKTGPQSASFAPYPLANMPHRGPLPSNMALAAPISAGGTAQRNSIGTPTQAPNVTSMNSTNMGNMGNPGALAAPEDAISDLSKQKAVNEELQRQILQNIRQQQHLVHSVRRGSDGSNGNRANNNPGENNDGISMGGNFKNRASMNQRGNQFANVQNNQFNNMQNTNQMNRNMLGNQMNGMQGNQFGDMQGVMASQRGSNMSGMGESAYAVQSSLMRHSSLPDATSISGSNNLSPAQVALMRQHSMPVHTGSNNINMEQAAMMGRGSGNSVDNQAMDMRRMSNSQAQQQEAALNMRRMSNSQAQQQEAARAQIQANMMRQGSIGNDQFSAAQRQAYMMGQNSGPMDPSAAQAEAAMMRQMSGSSQFNTNPAMQAEMMRRASLGNNNSFSGPSAYGQNAMAMNQHMAGNGTTRLPNGQVVPTQVLQSNPALLQQMNAGMQGQMTPNLQQQIGMGMGAQGHNSGAGNGNAGDLSDIQSKRNGDDAGVSRNSFSWY